jgi:hypothetical protein
MPWKHGSEAGIGLEHTVSQDREDDPHAHPRFKN